MPSKRSRGHRMEYIFFRLIGVFSYPLESFAKENEFESFGNTCATVRGTIYLSDDETFSFYQWVFPSSNLEKKKISLKINFIIYARCFFENIKRDIKIFLFSYLYYINLLIYNFNHSLLSFKVGLFGSKSLIY